MTPAAFVALIFAHISAIAESVRALALIALAAAINGNGLATGEDPDTPRQVEALVAASQSKWSGPNAWPELARLCDLALQTERAFYDKELADRNMDRAARGLPPLTLDSAEMNFNGAELAYPNVAQDLRDGTARLLDAQRAAGVFELQAALPVDRPFIRPIPPGPLLDRELPEIGPARALTRLGISRMAVAHAAGRNAESASVFRQMLATGRPFAYQATFLERLVGMAIVTASVDELRVELMDRPPNGAVLRDLLDALDAGMDWPPISHTLACERLIVHDTIARSYTEDGLFVLAKACQDWGATDETLPLKLLRSPRSLRSLMALRFPSKKEAERNADETAQDSTTWLGLPPRQRADSSLGPARLEERLKSEHDMVNAVCVPDLRRLATSLDILNVEIGGTRTMLAVEIFRAEHGTYPVRLAELVPGVIPALPTDPFTGHEFCYRRTDPDSDSTGWGRSYLLYSTGLDGHDDGGIRDPNGPVAAALPSALVGFDFVINDPHHRQR